MMKRLFLAGCFALSACVGNDFDQIFITDATIDIDLTSVMVILGGSGGDGVLTFTQVGGATGSCSVRMRGPLIGAMFGISGGAFSLPMELPAAEVPLSDLFGAYYGSAAGIALIIGGGNHAGSNRQDVSFEDGARIGGAGMFASVGWLRLLEPKLEDCTF
jgi:hypothetical protein